MKRVDVGFVLAVSTETLVRRLVRPMVLATLLGPVLANAQSAPHDMSTMPGMKMAPTPTVAASAPAKEKPGMGSGKAGPSKDDKMPGMEMAPNPAASRPSEAMQGMDHSQMKGMDKGMLGMDDGKMGSASDSKKPTMGMGSMDSMDMETMMKSMQGGAAPPDARDPDAYADGTVLGLMTGMDMADDKPYAYLLLDRLEAFHGKRENGQAIDAQAWFGGDTNKLWLKVDGERSGGRLGATRTEALWNHTIATYWGLQLGVRHDLGDGPTRTWGSFGFQGLSPYWFDVQATAYVGQNGRTALRFETEYDLLLTQRLVLQPDIKVSLYGKDDPERRIGSGLSDVDAGLRLRYEISRKFAPYLGVVWNRKFGTTASYARNAGDPVQQTKVVAGVRIWF